MGIRQLQLINSHRELADSCTRPGAEVFAILDLSDPVALAIASKFEMQAATHRDALDKLNQIAAMTLVMSVGSANQLLARGWPEAKPIPRIPTDHLAILLISENRCMVVFAVRRPAA